MKDKKRLKKIEGILTKDETIEKSFELKGYQVYATNKRLLRLEGRTVRDFDYNHISSVEYSSKRYWGLIIVGVIIWIIGIPLGGWIDNLLIWLFGIMGFLVIIIGIFLKSEWVETNVVGVKEPIKYPGQRDELDSLLKIIREKRAVDHTVSQKESKDSNFVETIRKLAELRDEGILTQEEFEEKKGKILRDSS